MIRTGALFLVMALLALSWYATTLYVFLRAFGYLSSP